MRLRRPPPICIAAVPFPAFAAWFLVMALASVLSGAPATAREWPSLAGERRWEALIADGERRNRADSLIIEDAYRAVLAAWAAGFELEAVEALRDLELRFQVETFDRTERRCYAALRGHTVEAIRRADPSALLAIAGLDRALAAALFPFHDRGLTEDLRERARVRLSEFAEISGEDADEAAARFLLAWADDRLARGYVDLVEPAAAALAAALVFDPGNEAARRLAAVVFERLGRPGDVLRLLESLADRDPVVDLRVGINRARILPRKGAAELASIARGDAPAWVRIVAYQELVRLERQLGHDETARALAAEAMARFPENERLAIQAAHLDFPRGAIELFETRSADSGLTPRVRYDESPRAMIDTEKRLARRELDTSRDHLLDALKKIDVGDPRRRRFDELCNRKLKLLAEGLER